MPGQGVSIAAVGQAAIKREVRGNPEPGFWAIRDLLKGADIAFTNLEATIQGAYGGWPTKAGYVGISPPYVLDALKELGFNVLSLANNHSFDLGPNGVLSAIEETERRGFIHGGLGRDLASASRAGQGTIDGRRVALIAIDGGPAPEAALAKDATEKVAARPGLNHQRIQPSFSVTPDELGMLKRIKDELGHERMVSRFRSLNSKNSKGSFLEVVDVANDELNFYGMRFQVGDRHERAGRLNPDDLQRNLAAIGEARKTADVVIVYLHHHHWEADWEAIPAWTKQFAHACIDAGADIYVSHGVPMLLGIEVYRHKPIFYSLGNFIFHSFNPTTWFHDNVWRSVVATSRFDGDGKVSEIQLDPIVVGGEAALAAKDFSNREVPVLASPAYGTEVLSHLGKLSAEFGTKIAIDNGRGFIRP